VSLGLFFNAFQKVGGSFTTTQAWTPSISTDPRESGRRVEAVDFLHYVCCPEMENFCLYFAFSKA